MIKNIVLLNQKERSIISGSGVESGGGCNGNGCSGSVSGSVAVNKNVEVTGSVSGSTQSGVNRATVGVRFKW